MATQWFFLALVLGAMLASSLAEPLHARDKKLRDAMYELEDAASMLSFMPSMDAEQDFMSRKRKTKRGRAVSAPGTPAPATPGTPAPVIPTPAPATPTPSTPAPATSPAPSRRPSVTPSTPVATAAPPSAPSSTAPTPATGSGEIPKYNKKIQYRMYRRNIPLDTPNKGTSAYEALENFAKEVKLILQTVNENEYQAATTYMKPPTKDFKRAVFFPMTSMVVGIFAGKKTALIQARVGEYVDDYVEDAIKAFPKTKYVIGVGVCYAFDRDEYKFGDVLVSDKIADLKNFKFLGNGEIEDRGQTVDIVYDLVKIFAINMNIVPEFRVTTGGRNAKVDRGTILSYSVLMNNKQERDKFHRAVPKAKGGEMEGRELIKFEERGEVKGVIIIKGVVDFADGTKDKDWQFTAALAALAYTQTKMKNVPDDLEYV